MRIKGAIVTPRWLIACRRASRFEEGCRHNQKLAWLEAKGLQAIVIGEASAGHGHDDRGLAVLTRVRWLRGREETLGRDIKDDDIVVQDLAPQQAGIAVAGEIHVVALLDQALSEISDRVGFTFDEQDLHGVGGPFPALSRATPAGSSFAADWISTVDWRSCPQRHPRRRSASGRTQIGLSTIDPVFSLTAK
ncbi:hypothetical protein [Caulobacter sp. UC70_42]|uniref:hypothetical protein n=1 Tax=Caulobacter sp. UC70_42 TaxID=3374551 RepID=UPI0037563B3E